MSNAQATAAVQSRALCLLNSSPPNIASAAAVAAEATVAANGV